MKKLILSALVLFSIGDVNVSAGERIIHKECFLHPVLVKQVKEYDSIHDLAYMKNEFYDSITGNKIDLMFETIYMDNDNNRWYFPYDGTKFHYHEEVK